MPSANLSSRAAELIELGFRQVGELVSRDGAISYTCFPGSGTAPSVYVVVAEKPFDENCPSEVWYVGSAFQGWKSRHRQHNGGLKRRADGGTEYREHLNGGGVFRVFERAAATHCAFGHATWAQEAEEAILIALLKPTRNKQKLNRLVSQNPE